MMADMARVRGWAEHGLPFDVPHYEVVGVLKGFLGEVDARIAELERENERLKAEVVALRWAYCEDGNAAAATVADRDHA